MNYSIHSIQFSLVKLKPPQMNVAVQRNSLTQSCFQNYPRFQCTPMLLHVQGFKKEDGVRTVLMSDGFF